MTWNVKSAKFKKSLKLLNTWALYVQLPKSHQKSQQKVKQCIDWQWPLLKRLVMLKGRPNLGQGQKDKWNYHKTIIGTRAVMKKQRGQEITSDDVSSVMNYTCYPFHRNLTIPISFQSQWMFFTSTLIAYLHYVKEKEIEKLNQSLP